MKKLKNYITLFILTVSAVFTSCNDTYEFHQKYIEGGEIIYTNKVDSLKTLPGNQRIEIQGYISNAFTVKEIEVFWDEGKNSQKFDYSKSSDNTDFLELVIENLEERAYEFEVYSKDSDGNKSVRVLTYGTAYGEVYRSNLTARFVDNFSYTKDSVNLTFKRSDEFTRNTEVKYTNNNNEEIVNTLAPDESLSVLYDVDDSKPIKYRTFYVPSPKDEYGNETTIDEFGSDWLTYDYPFELKAIIESITYEPVLGGVNVKWDNPENLEVTLNFRNFVGGEAVNHTITSSDTQGSYIVGGMESGEQILEVTVENIYKNSWSGSITVTPTPAVLLDKSGWTVIDFDSEEPNRVASNVIDGDLSTFWHSAWSNAQPVYPHFITVDMGAEKNVASFEMFRRPGAWWAANKHEFWVSSDNVNWTKVASYDDWLRDDNGVVVALPEAVKARYFKYVAVEGYDYYAFLAEINVYGLEE